MSEGIAIDQASTPVTDGPTINPAPAGESPITIDQEGTPERKASPIRSMAATNALLIAHFADQPKGTRVTFEDMEKVAGGRGNMQTIRVRLIADHGKVLLNIRGVGYEVGEDATVVEVTAAKFRQGIGGMSRRHKKVLKTIDPTKLDDSKRKEYWQSFAVAGTLSHILSHSGTKKIENMVDNLTDASALAQNSTAMTLAAIMAEKTTPDAPKE